MLLSHNDEHSLYSNFTRDLQDEWDVEDEGEVSDLLSVEITREEDHVVLRQQGYVEKMMRNFAPDGVPAFQLDNPYLLSDHPSSRTPAEDGRHGLPQLVADALTQDATDIDPALLKAYQSLVGALLYCAVNTRPDVAYSVGMVCRATGKPTPELYCAALRILCYLHHHRSLGLRYAAGEFELSGMSDSDWAVRHSTAGFVFQYSQAAISWASRKQASVALSSCEAEIMALSEAGKEGVYLSPMDLSRFLDELGLGLDAPLKLATDNSGACDLSYNPEHHERVKHIERRHFYIRELVEEQLIVVPYVSTAENIADFLTKPLDAKHFYPLRNTIKNVSDSEK